MRSVHRSAGSLPHAVRRGFSLIEVIMATAILMGSAVVLSRLVGLGRTHAQNTEKLAEAQRLCENTLNEILLGIRPLSPVESAPLIPVDRKVPRAGDHDRNSVPEHTLDPTGAESSPRWQYSIRIRRERRTRGLISLTVEVSDAKRAGGRRMRYALTRWIHQPPQQGPFNNDHDPKALSFGGINS